MEQIRRKGSCPVLYPGWIHRGGWVGKRVRRIRIQFSEVRTGRVGIRYRRFAAVERDFVICCLLFLFFLVSYQLSVIERSL